MLLGLTNFSLFAAVILIMSFLSTTGIYGDIKNRFGRLYHENFKWVKYTVIFIGIFVVLTALFLFGIYISAH
jgi:hypothetical protein